MIPLFEEYPLLAKSFPYISLCELPTPVQKLEKLGSELGVGNLYMKCDNLSGKIYGGNKPRKLEFILGKALRSDAREVMTFGGAGSNHALATAIYAQQAGLNSISMLMPQPNARYVGRNLILSHYFGAELHCCGAGLESILKKPLLYPSTLYQLLRHRLKRGALPQIIPTGGSSPVGITGFVNAALELKKQIENREMPEPDCIYVACGTMGTAAGLILGLKAANLKTRVVPVRVTGERLANARGMIRLINNTNSLLHNIDNSFPIFEFSSADIGIRHEFFGKGYAFFTKKGMEAVYLMEDCEGIKLEGTYTGKALAALIDDAKNERLQNITALFWNTFNSRGFPESITDIDYHDLPGCLHRYFEEESQPLDFNL